MATTETPDFESMTKAELLEYADGIGVSGLSAAMKKADIIAALGGGEHD